MVTDRYQMLLELDESKELAEASFMINACLEENAQSKLFSQLPFIDDLD